MDASICKGKDHKALLREETMRRNYKNYFLGKGFNSTLWRLLCTQPIYLMWILLGIFTPSYYPDGLSFSERIFTGIVAVIVIALVFSIPIILLPVVVYGSLWQKCAALLLSAPPVVVILSFLMEIL